MKLCIKLNRRTVQFWWTTRSKIVSGLVRRAMSSSVKSMEGFSPAFLTVVCSQIHFILISARLRVENSILKRKLLQRGFPTFPALPGNRFSWVCAFRALPELSVLPVFSAFPSSPARGFSLSPVARESKVSEMRHCRFFFLVRLLVGGARDFGSFDRICGRYEKGNGLSWRA